MEKELEVVELTLEEVAEVAGGRGTEVSMGIHG